MAGVTAGHTADAIADILVTELGLSPNRAALVAGPLKILAAGIGPGKAIAKGRVGGAKGVSGSSSLLDQKATTHILDGDGPTSGGHRFGTGVPGKSEFPQNWSGQKIVSVISDIASDPKVQWSKPDARGYATASSTHDGVDVKVVYDTKNGRVVTGYPTNLQRILSHEY